jgi:uncharacterized membrane protein YedE/YeeE
MGAFTGFTPVRGVVGGAVIGLTAAVLLLFNGDVFGCSGIASSLVLRPPSSARAEGSWKAVLVASFFLTSALLPPRATDDPRLYGDPALPAPSAWAYVLGGFLVSFGAYTGSGCTTGHGVCGMARLSRRSFAAVGTFMAAAILTAVAVSRAMKRQQTSGRAAGAAFQLWTSAPVFDDIYIPWLGWLLSLALVLWALVSLPPREGPLSRREEQPLTGGSDMQTPQQASCARARARAKLLPAAAAGALFSLGLAVSGMDLQSKNLAFLDVSKIPAGLWDPTLVLVMASAVLVSFASYQLVPGFGVLGTRRLECPIMLGPAAPGPDGGPAAPFDVPNRTVVDARLVAGAACFGWGITGLCPGPAWLQAASGNQAVVFFYAPTYLLGIVSADRLARRLEARSSLAYASVGTEVLPK